MTVQVLMCSERVLARVKGPPQRGFVHSAFASAANLSFTDGFLLSLNASTHLFKKTTQKTEAQGSLSLLPEREMSSRALSLQEARTGRNTTWRSPVTSEEKMLASPLMPNGILLATYRGTFPFTALKTGMLVVLGAGWLTLSSISYALDCSNCPSWNPRIEPWRALNRKLLAANADLIAQLCETHRTLGSGELPAFEDGTTLERLAQKLCGRGPGLTPSGDDFLAGYMAVGWLLYGPQPSFLASCQRVNEIAQQRTHVLSQCWLAYAAAGDVAQPIGALLRALAGQDRAHLEQSTRNVLALGATSGYDLLQGILYGIKHFLL